MKFAGECDGALGAADRHGLFNRRLTQHLQYAMSEFRHLIEEEHTPMRQRKLAWSGPAAAAAEACVGEDVMRRVEQAGCETQTGPLWRVAADIR